MRRLACCLLALMALPSLAVAARLEELRLAPAADGTHLVLRIAGDIHHSLFTLEHPDRLVLNLKGATRAAALAMPAGQGVVKRVRLTPRAGGNLRIVLDLERRVRVRSALAAPDGATHRLVLALVPLDSSAAKAGGAARARGHPAGATPATAPTVAAAEPAQPVVVRALPATRAMAARTRARSGATARARRT